MLADSPNLGSSPRTSLSSKRPNTVCGGSVIAQRLTTCHCPGPTRPRTRPERNDRGDRDDDADRQGRVLAPGALASTAGGEHARVAAACAPLEKLLPLPRLTRVPEELEPASPVSLPSELLPQVVKITTSTGVPGSRAGPRCQCGGHARECRAVRPGPHKWD